MHFRVQSLYPSSQNFREAGKFLNCHVRYRFRSKERCRAAGRDYLDAHLTKSPREWYDTTLVRNRNQGTPDLHSGKKVSRFLHIVY